MRIVSIIRRKAGTDVTFDGVLYRFRPEVEGDFTSLHVADVEDEGHVQRFLAIPEGYKLHPDVFMPPKVNTSEREAELLASVELLTSKIAEQDAKIADLTGTLLLRDTAIDTLNVTVADLTRELEQATAPVQDPQPVSESQKPPKRK
jgi:hypothetical protein